MPVASLRTLIPRGLRRSARDRFGPTSAPEPDAPAPAPEPPAAAARPPDAPDLACRAPFTSLHIDQFGDARPCCRSLRVLGNIAEQTIDEIWTGGSLAELRTAIEHDDLSLGCDHCAWAGRSGRETTYAVRFDHDRLPEPGAGPTRLELAPSNSCNLQCAMCNGDWSSSIRLHREGRPALPRRFGEAQVAEVEALAPGLDEIHLFGGEPFLMPEALRVLEIAAVHDISCVITTNGSVLTPRVAQVIDRPGVHLVVSIDGTSAEVYEAVRLGASWSVLDEHLGVFGRIARRHGNRLDIAHCLMTVNWHEFADHLTWAHERALSVYVNDVHSPVEMSLHHLTPLELGEVVRQMHQRDAEIATLPEPWRTTWEQSITRLEQTLRDGAAGGRHEHLGQLTASTSSDPASEGAPAPLRLHRDDEVGARMRVVFDLDGALIIRSVRADGQLDLFPIGDVDRWIGRASASVRTLLASQVGPDARMVLQWDPAAAVEERRYDLDGRGYAERRTLTTVEASVQLAFDYWRPPSMDERIEVLRAATVDGRLVTFEIDRGATLRAIEPVDLAEDLGLRTEIGITFSSPTDALIAARADPPPIFTADEVEPGIVSADLRWDDGHRLLALADATVERTIVRIGRAAATDAD